MLRETIIAGPATVAPYLLIPTLLAHSLSVAAHAQNGEGVAITNGPHISQSTPIIRRHRRPTLFLITLDNC